MIVTFVQCGIQDYPAIMVRSVKETMNCHLVQFSDEGTPRIDGVDECIVYRTTGPIPLFRLQCWGYGPYKEAVHLDTDVVVKQDLSHVFEQDFEYAFTARHGASKKFNGWGTMPYNIGVQFARGQELYREALEWTKPLTFNQQADILCDQAAICAVAHKYRITELPIDVYNWTPSGKGQEHRAKVIHYKGNRKEWMKADYGNH